MATPDFLMEALDNSRSEEQRIYGLGIGRVINNIDATGMARVQVSLPWMPGIEPWARIVTPSAGALRGIYFVPQIDDEVIVAFNHGDVTDAYVMGSLWNTLDRPPASLPTDPVTKRLIVTPAHQTIAIDDLEQSVTITNSTQQKIELGIDAVMLEAGTVPPPVRASVKLDSVGNITIDGAVSITLKAPNITIDGTNVTVKGTASTTLQSAGDCVIKGALVHIN
jgi:phage baseplate assembly protein gpV